MKKSFSWRIFISFALFLSLFMMLISGVILYRFPGGSSSGVIGEFLGLTKPAWQHQHTIFGFVFAIFSFCHLFFINWKAFFSYLKKKTTQGRQSSAELLTTTMLTSFIAIGTYAGIQTFSGILNTGKVSSNSLEQRDKDAQDPLAETKSLNALSRHHDFENDHHRERGSELIALEREETEEGTATALSTNPGNKNQQEGYTPAPDDELHRSTKASCASCH